MSDIVINPIHWSAEQLVSYGHDIIHELALKAAGTLNSYHLVLGRCLLAVHRTKLYEFFACSGAVHYGTQVLGLRAQKARTLRWVAQKLEALPQLSRAGGAGEIDWSKIREVVRKASPETEGYWLELCRLKNYRQIERLVRFTPKGAIPGDLPAEGDKEPTVTDLRLQLGLTAQAIVERGLQLFSLKQGRPVPLAEAVESLFAQLLEKDTVGGTGSCPADLGELAKSQEEARKDILAASLGRDHLVQEAREIAQAMGVTGTADGANAIDVAQAATRASGSNNAALPLSEIYSELMESSETMVSDTDSDCESSNETPAADQVEAPAREIVATEEHPARESDTTEKRPAREMVATEEQPARETCGDAYNEKTDSSAEIWAQILAAHHIPCPGNDAVTLVVKDWRNPRLRFNPKTRVPTAAQRREILRRDGYCCSTPGCPNHLWLEVHHVVFYSRKGGTISVNLVTLCSRCHKNVHNGHLRISGQAPDKLIYQDRDGNDLARLHDIGVAGWLDFWHGWRGKLEDSHQHRLANSGGAASEKPSG